MHTKDNCFLYYVPQPVQEKETELGHKETLSRDKDIQQEKKEEKTFFSPKKKINNKTKPTEHLADLMGSVGSKEKQFKKK